MGGTKLFTRRPGSRLVLTAAGRSLIKAADDLLTAAAAFRDTAQRIAAGEGVTVRIGAYGTALTYLLPPVLALLVDQESVATVETTEIEPADGLRLLERGDLDVLIAHRYLPEARTTTKNTVVTELGREPLLLVASASSRLRRLADCTDVDWVAGGLSDVDRQLLNRWSATVGLDPRVSHETRDCHTAAELIASGFAVGLLPASVASAPRLSARLSVVTLPAKVRAPYRDVLAITRSDTDMPAMDELVRELRDLLSRHHRP